MRALPNDASERGVPLLSEPSHAGNVRVFRIADPDGYIIEIFAFV